MDKTPEQPAVLEARRMSKTFRLGVLSGPQEGTRQLRAVDGVSLALREGRCTALVGESGSGKSTVARLLAQAYPPTQGELILDGSVVRYRRFGQARRRFTGQVQLIYQDPFASLNPVHTVRYHLERASRAHGRHRHDVDDHVARLLERVSLKPAGQFLGKMPHELSGGQRQRVAIARALAAGPRVLLADEPVSMLDVSIRLGVLNLLASLKGDRMAILYITHDMASARYFADDILVMYGGQLVEGGPAEDITQRPAHPYTQLLIDSAPDPNRIGQPRQKAVKPGGRTGAQQAAATGCRFARRCPHAMAKCAEPPPAVSTGSSHWMRCWLPLPTGADKNAPYRLPSA